MLAWAASISFWRGLLEGAVQNKSHAAKLQIVLPEMFASTSWARPERRKSPLIRSLCRLRAHNWSTQHCLRLVVILCQLCTAYAAVWTFGFSLLVIMKLSEGVLLWKLAAFQLMLSEYFTVFLFFKFNWSTISDNQNEEDFWNTRSCVSPTKTAQSQGFLIPRKHGAVFVGVKLACWHHTPASCSRFQPSHQQKPK